MKTLAILNQKGGVGKTTTAVTLAHGLARHGLDTLLVDLDAQGNVADSLGLPKTDALYTFLIEHCPGACITPSGRDNLGLILGHKRTVEAKQVLSGMNFREYVLKRKLAEVSGYEVAVLDVAPGVDVLQVAALVAADAFIVPVSLDHLAVVGAGDILASVAALNQVGAFSGRFLGILPTRWERKTTEGYTQLQLLTQHFKQWVWPPIPEDVTVKEAHRAGKTLWEFAPSCRALKGTELKNGVLAGGYAQVLEKLLGVL
jgi:chromosome partitioning protein